MRALKGVDQVMLSIDENPPVTETLEMIARQYPGCQLVFANGGDRSAPEVVPERDVCEKYNIEMVYGVGGSNKADSSTRINQATGQESNLNFSDHIFHIQPKFARPCVAMKMS